MPFLWMERAEDEDHDYDVDRAGLYTWREIFRGQVPRLCMNFADGGRHIERVILNELDGMVSIVVCKQRQMRILIGREERKDRVACATANLCDGDRTGISARRSHQFRKLVV